ncbi:MAG: (E)-4-hydroxy-3-methylbut-2-enyl-diphosphate synthase [Dysgonamonadaceae bacterium]|jgi:(E)-4-hydroxy-3-methylbut-2-enyl-diphosphate synthase|nr:(E)-4-hydroxy-3-methylbut-2-enyl-diphosphate synthase [Dysgonamonadaceae bacterium]
MTSSLVNIGSVPLGAGNPVRIQSMTNTSTMDTQGCIGQCIRIIEAGADYVRLTAQGVREAENLRNIRDGLRARGYNTPLIADIHFNATAAFAAAEIVEKVRINPGNFAPSGCKSGKSDFTKEEFQADLQKIRERFVPFLEVCKKHNTAVRIGVNHGSLSERIMNRYGDTPEGMVESCMEYLKICMEQNFREVVISMKASNPRVMIAAVRLLVRRMKQENMSFPLHLGVTEAGEGDDGRIKSAVGIGTLLYEGIGDTIRVSLSEDPEAEIPVAKALVDYIRPRGRKAEDEDYEDCPPAPPAITPIVLSRHFPKNSKSSLKPDIILEEEKENFQEINDLNDINEIKVTFPTLLSIKDLPTLRAAARRLRRTAPETPIYIRRVYDEADAAIFRLKAAADCGYFFLEGLADGILLENLNPAVSDEEICACAFGILQATGVRISKTEYISCPSCGRTLFDLQSSLRKVKAATAHLKGLKIAVMGCIVNGPGEMADADFGYVGAGKGKVSLYRGKNCVKRNIPEEQAVEELLKIIEAE